MLYNTWTQEQVKFEFDNIEHKTRNHHSRHQHYHRYHHLASQPLFFINYINHFIEIYIQCNHFSSKKFPYDLNCVVPVHTNLLKGRWVLSQNSNENLKITKSLQIIWEKRQRNLNHRVKTTLSDFFSFDHDIL